MHSLKSIAPRFDSWFESMVRQRSRAGEWCFRIASVVFVAFCATNPLVAGDTNRASSRDAGEVWFPHQDSPKLTTPQWVGEANVDCVVTLAIDDMREPAKYEAYLRPILQRLKQIDGRAPVSIMTCNVKPDDPQLQEWLKEGLSLECHTADHPCPILAGGDLKKAKATYDKCVDLLGSIPNNKPVAFRTPCCDSLNTVSPRLFSEIINKATPQGNFLQLDSSIFTLYTANDPGITRELLVDPDGKERFRKYIPRKLTRGNLVHDGFVNIVENYPYPYIIGNRCWEFPCMVPSDWSANHLHKPNNPDTVRDLKAALDITVRKQGVFNLVFHPHGWIKSEQVIELIDHAVNTHGKKVKFLNFSECVERLNKNLTNDTPLRGQDGSDQCVRLFDVNQDGFVDVVRADVDSKWSRVWNPANSRWNEHQLASFHEGGRQPIPHEDWSRGLFSVPADTGKARYEVFGVDGTETWDWQENGWKHAFALAGIAHQSGAGVPRDYDLDGDGRVDRLSVVQPFEGGARLTAYCWFPAGNTLNRVPIALALPNIESFRSKNEVPWSELERTRGARLIDIDQDGWLDLVVSNSTEFGVWLMHRTYAQPQQLLHDKRGDGKTSEMEFPPIVLEDGSDNGFFVRDRQLCWINENTDNLPDFIMRVAFDTLIGDRLPGAKGPEAARQSMHAAPGYRVDLVAHEPLTMDPVALDWGPDGKMWVAEMADYPRGIDDKGQPGGRIRFLEDTNDDGLYEKSTLFLDDVPFPNGVLCWKRGVLVSAAPDVFYAEDTDGDGKADLKKVLYTGFAEGNQQHRANGFSRGLDNWLYLANGDSGGTIRVVGRLIPPAYPGNAEEGKSIDIRGRDIRIRPDTGEIEAIAGQSQFGRNRDDWGNWFGNNNSRPMWHYVLDDHYMRRNPHLIAPATQKDVSIAPGASPVFPLSRTLTRFNDFHTANRFTSACSSMVFRDAFPGSDEGTAQVFISEPVHNLVHREIMTPDGLSFTSRRAAGEEQSEFLASTDNWFRPTQIKTGPDGALYVADMYRLVIEHPQWIPIEWQRKLDLRAGHDKGRVWRVAPVENNVHKMPRLNSLQSPTLIALLFHRNGWTRDMAQQLLIDRAEQKSIGLLQSFYKTPPNEPLQSIRPHSAVALGRVHVLCTLDGLANKGILRDEALVVLKQTILMALNDPHPGVRRHAVRLCENFPELDIDLRKLLAPLVADRDPQVRLQLAYTLGELKPSEVGYLLGQLAVAGPMKTNTESNPPLNPQFTAAILSSLNNDNLAQVLAEAMKQGSAQTELLQQLLAQATAFNHEPALISLLTRATEPSVVGRFEPWQYSAVEQFLVSLDRRFLSLEKWLKELSAQSRPIESRLQTLFAAARKLAASDAAATEDRIAAIKVLGRSADARDDISLLAELITPRHPPELQSAALATLARSKSGEIAMTLLTNYRSFAPALRTQTSEILLSRDAWRDELLKSLEAAELAPSDLDAATRQRLLDHKTKAVAERAAKVLAINLNSNRAKLVADYLPTVRTGGDEQLGSQLFKKMCSQCHKLGDVGHAVGPDLMSLTDKSPDAMITAVLDPNRAVETKFLTFTVVTRAGVTHTGLMASETAGSITLRGAEGKEINLLRTEIEELQSTAKSLMPEGLERDLKPADAAALIAYIRRNVPLPAMKAFPGNAPHVVAADAAGNFQLTPAAAEVYGPTIVIEDKHRNLGWWSSADDIVVWTINVAKPGIYTISWTYACEPNAAGNRLVVEAAGKTVTHRVDQTENWDSYQTRRIGELELPTGEVRVTLKPASRPLPALADVKEVLLTPQ